MPQDQVQTDTLQLTANGAVALGSVAQKLVANGMNVAGLRTNDVLTKDEWVQYDNAIVGVARQRLVAVGALMDRGLSYSINNGLGTTVVQWDQASDMSGANVDMSGTTAGEEDRMVFELKALPLPITHKDFRINIRNLLASRRNGDGLDTTQAEMAARLVAEKIESVLFDGSSITGGGGTIYGYTNFPQRNTGSISNWALGATTGEVIVTNVLSMIGDLQQNNNMYGPYELYVPYDYWNRLMDDYKAASDRTILERILAIPGVEAVRPSNNLSGGASGEVVMAQMTKDVVDMVDALQPTNVQWESHGGMVQNFKVMAIMVPRLKADQNAQCGIAHYSV